MLELIKSLLERDYKISEIKKITKKDVSLMVEALKIEEEKVTTLDKAFPMIFG